MNLIIIELKKCYSIEKFYKNTFCLHHVAIKKNKILKLKVKICKRQRQSVNQKAKTTVRPKGTL